MSWVEPQPFAPWTAACRILCSGAEIRNGNETAGHWNKTQSAEVWWVRKACKSRLQPIYKTFVLIVVLPFYVFSETGDEKKYFLLKIFSELLYSQWYCRCVCGAWGLVSVFPLRLGGPVRWKASTEQFCAVAHVGPVVLLMTPWWNFLWGTGLGPSRCIGDPQPDPEKFPEKEVLSGGFQRTQCAVFLCTLNDCLSGKGLFLVPLFPFTETLSGSAACLGLQGEWGTELT